MPEYLAPGVYVEEIEIGPKPIEGVSTSTAGFLGPTERGPITPTLITGFEEYLRLFGRYLDNSYLAYAVEGFFTNGGKRCFVGRITRQNAKTATEENSVLAEGTILLEGENAPQIRLQGIGPGDWGNRIFYKIGNPTQQVAIQNGENSKTTRFKLSLIYYSSMPPTIEEEGKKKLKVDPTDPDSRRDSATAKDRREPDLIEIYDNLSVDPSSSSFYKNEVDGISHIAVFYDNIPKTPGEVHSIKIPEIDADTGKEKSVFIKLENGNDGKYDGNSGFKIDDYKGLEIKFTDPLGSEVTGLQKCGLRGFEGIEDISILCIPDESSDLRGALIDHCEDLKYRFAIIQSKRTDVGDIGKLETGRDSKYAALYFPWINVYDPLTGGTRLIPPGGHMAGIYARSDNNRGVHKAPANEPVRGVTSLQVVIDKGKQEILNPKGINVIRSFPGRGIILWGARTISTDPLWKYVNVRRLFIFIERSIDEGTQWLVFEPNNERLWSRVIATIKQFLTQVWRDGALMGTTPEEAFFVKCDRTTMTQNDIDNGRLICVIGIAPVKPAEFVIFRIAQTRSGTEVTET
jgi:phage tail sheath protein FI